MFKQQLKKLVLDAIAQARKKGAFPTSAEADAGIMWPKESDHGEYATAIAFELAKKSGISPLQAAQALEPYLKADFLEKIEIAGKGFINFYISKKSLASSLKQILALQEKYGASQEGRSKVMVIDYSSPNIAKPFGIGHLRSTIIGQAIYNIYGFLGWRCIGDNHLGDWGTQFGKLIYQIKKENVDLDDLTINKLEELYVRFHEEARNAPEMEQSAREWFKKLEEKDIDAVKIWEKCRKISLQEFDRIYEMLGVHIDYTMGESFYADKTQEIIDAAKKAGFAKKSEGALIFEFPNNKLPALVMEKSDGTSMYFARDLAAAKYRAQEWNPDILAYEVGTDQELYMKQVFLACDLLEIAPKEKFVYIGHGLIRSPEGKFSTRRGQTVHLEEVLDEAIKKAREMMESAQKGKDLSENEKTELARHVGIGAIKYNDLSQHHSQDIIFDWDKLLNLKGNSGPYIQYTYVRCKSVLGKETGRDYLVEAFTPQESALLGNLIKFEEIIKNSAVEFSPNILCNFLFSLCQAYNHFYDVCPIITAPSSEIKNFRLALTQACAQVIKIGLDLLGIEAPEQM